MCEISKHLITTVEAGKLSIFLEHTQERANVCVKR